MKNRTVYRLLCTAALLLGVAAQASGQDADRLQRARAGLPRPAADRLDKILQAATARGLPTSPLVDKALEGEAKQAPPDRIVAVVALLADNLGHARTMLLDFGSPGLDDITAVADAIRRGVPEKTIRALRAHQPRRPFALPVETLADLIQQGVPDEDAVVLLQAWSDRGGDNAELRDLPAAVERLIHQGTIPARAAEAIAQSMSGGAHGPPAGAGKSGSAPGQIRKATGSPVSPGAGPPPGKQKGGPPKPAHPGKH